MQFTEHEFKDGSAVRIQAAAAEPSRNLFGDGFGCQFLMRTSQTR